jgi:hypothetical protein
MSPQWQEVLLQEVWVQTVLLQEVLRRGWRQQ